MASISVVNPRADILRKKAALTANTNAAIGLQEVIRSNLGPNGTLKMLVGGGLTLKLTKDGNVLLREMQIQHPTAAMIARASTAQDSITGDGTTTSVLVLGELMRSSERYLIEGVHPRLLCEGIDKARAEALAFLETEKGKKLRIPASMTDREILRAVSRTSLRTKLEPRLADQLTDIVVDAVMIIKQAGEDADLHMVEVLHIKQRMASDMQLVKGMVMDHGCRHPDMPRRLKNAYILTCNVSLEYEKTEVNSGFFYSTPEERERLVMAERRFTDEKVQKIVELKRKVCTPENKRTMIVLNQKGIDPPSLDILAREGIMALRRVKRRNMERLTLCCGGSAVNSVDDLSVDDLGFAQEVWEEQIGDEKWTFVEGVEKPKSCCVLVRGPNDHTIKQIEDAIRDGLRAVKNVLDDKCVVPGAGAFEIALSSHLSNFARTSVSGKAKFGVMAVAEALLVVPKALAENSGLDAQDSILRLTEHYEKDHTPVGLDLTTGEPICPATAGIYDNYSVKRQLLSIAPLLGEQLLLVDEIIRAGKVMKK